MRELLGVDIVIVVDADEGQDPTAAFRNLATHDGGVSGWRLLWEKCNPFGKEEGTPSYAALVNRLVAATANRQLDQVAREHPINLHLRPPTTGISFGPMDARQMEAAVRNAYKYAAAAVVEWQLTGKGGFPTDAVNEALQSTKRSIARAASAHAQPASMAAAGVPAMMGVGIVPAVVPGLPMIPPPAPRTISLPPVEEPRKGPLAPPEASTVSSAPAPVTLPSAAAALLLAEGGERRPPTTLEMAAEAAQFAVKRLRGRARSWTNQQCMSQLSAKYVSADPATAALLVRESPTASAAQAAAELLQSPSSQVGSSGRSSDGGARPGAPGERESNGEGTATLPRPAAAALCGVRPDPRSAPSRPPATPLLQEQRRASQSGCPGGPRPRPPATRSASAGASRGLRTEARTGTGREERVRALWTQRRSLARCAPPPPALRGARRLTGKPVVRPPAARRPEGNGARAARPARQRAREAHPAGAACAAAAVVARADARGPGAGGGQPGVRPPLLRAQPSPALSPGASSR